MIIINAYNYYKQARNASWQCLLDVGITSLPVKTLRITEYFGIDVLRDSEVKMLRPKESGCCFIDKQGKWTIVYDDSESPDRNRFTIAHELGHILLGHEIEAGFGHFRRIVEGKPITETQADEFAARLLAPACVLWALDVSSAGDIAALCGISDTAARIRAKRMAVLKERNMFLTHPLEKKLFAAFEPWIEQQKNRPD
ncbi:MAG: ImmA/IrrE family metallo-endopeptidase [Oscillospiraceae bacterium]|nr:ImmA/IrrE family metallo-endopeptidase [Oscillospiraceae bacterium]